MKPRIAILAALPREIAPLIRNWPRRSRSRNEGWMIAESDRAVAVCAGMGRGAITRALELAESRGPLEMLLSIGYAGALHSGITRNTLYWPAIVIDAQTGEQYRCEDGAGTLVTTDAIVGEEEKMQLAKRWNADLVDMEAATVARLAKMRGLRFRTLRAVSDEAGEKLPDLNRFTDQQGRFHEAAFASYVALRPWVVPGVIRLARHTAHASRAISQALQEFLERAE